MNRLICRSFIKNSGEINNPIVRLKYGKLAGIIGIVSNLLLFTFKFVLGIVSGCISIVADAINNLSDMASSVITLIGFKMAGKKPDKEHPFGHERIEYIMGLIVAIIILVIGIELGKTSIDKIIHPVESVFNLWIALALGLAIIVKIWQALFYRYVGKKINSVALIATSSDSKNDVIATTVVLIGFVCSMLFHINLDGYFGTLVAIFIVISGIMLVKDTMNPLIGERPDQDFIKKISEKILNYPGVYGIHDMICHSYGETKVFMTVHVEVSSSVPVMESHELIDDIEHDIKEEFNVELTIHLDPVELDNEELNKVRERLTEIVSSISSDLKFHDLRMVKGVNHTNLIFDLVIPFKKEDNRGILYQISSEVKKIDSKYNCVINLDEDYVD